jgi:type VI secretion system Hcp family effector
VLGLPWFVIDTQATVSIFLDLKNDKIEGEVTSKDHKGEIDVLSMDFGVSSSTTMLKLGSPEFQDISITKYTDKSTPQLMHRLLAGQPISSAKIKFVETINGKEVPVVTLELKDSLVTSHSSGSSNSQDQPTENLTLNFKQFSVETFSYDGSINKGSSSIVTWDRMTGTGNLGGVNNDKPMISAIAGQTIDEDSFTAAIPFTITDPEAPAGTLTVSKSTNNPQVVPLSGITLSGTGRNRTVAIKPAPNAHGSAAIAITVTDAFGLTATQSFTITVKPINDAPTIQPIANQVTDQNKAVTTGINVGDIDTAAAKVKLTAVSGNPSLIPAANITFTGSGATTQMTLNPVSGATGSALITLSANDGAADSSSVSFTLTVNRVIPSGPTDINWQVSPLVAENSAEDTAVGTLVTSDPNHSGSQITYTLPDSAGGRFKVGSLGNILVANGSLLDFETSPSHSITVRATDPDGNVYDKVLQIQLSNVNEAPVIASTPLGTVSQYGSMRIAGLSIGDPDAGSAEISVSFAVSGGSLYLDQSGVLEGRVSGNETNSVTVTATITDINSVLGANGLTYYSFVEQGGTYSLSINANDLGNTGSGGPKSASTTLNITVTPGQVSLLAQNRERQNTSLPSGLVVAPTPFGQWQQEHFTTQVGDLSVSGPNADFDKDGIANLLEYGVGSDPTDAADGQGLVVFTEETVEGIAYPAIRFKRLIGKLDPSLIVKAELATDQFNWRSDPGDTVEVRSSPLSETHEEVVIRSSLPIHAEVRQLMRLRFALEP